MSRFTNDVLRERAVLAIEDPDGEADALVPMTRKQAFDILFSGKGWEKQREAPRGLEEPDADGSSEHAR